MKLPIKILFKQIAGTHKDHMEHIGKINTTLLELTGQSSNFVGGTASQAQIEVVQYYNKLRENSKKLYSLFHEHFPTKCHCIKEYYAAHSANLRLLRFSEKSSTQLKVLFGCDKYHRAPSPSWIELDFIPTECSWTSSKGEKTEETEGKKPPAQFEDDKLAIPEENSGRIRSILNNFKLAKFVKLSVSRE